MSYNSNKAYGNSISYSFSSSTSGVSEYTPISNQMEYSNKTVISYSGGGGNNLNDFNYANRGNNGNDYNAKSGNSFLGGMGGGGKGMMGGGGSGRRRGDGIGKSKEQRKGIGNKGQECIDMQNQFIVERKNDDPLTEIDLTIKSLNLSDSPQNQVITQEVAQLEMIYYKKITFIKKAKSKQDHLELIIRKVESLSKKYKKNIIRL